MHARNPSFLLHGELQFFFFLKLIPSWGRTKTQYTFIHRYEGALDPWLLSLWRTLNQIYPSILPRMSDILHPEMRTLENAKFQVIYHSADSVQQDSDMSGEKENS